MAKINFMDRDNVLREYELTDEAITMGREATNKVVIADPSVSRQHAWIEKRPDGYYLVDKNSSNGTYVNGKKVTQQKLNHNDKVNLGSASLVFEDEDEGATFILNRQELPDVTRAEEERFNPNERVTDALNADDVGVREDRPLPPPPPRVSPQPAPPPPPAPRPSVQTSAPPIPPPPAAPPAPAPQAAKPDQETPVGILCPSCRKVVEQGARFCPFCGASLGPSKAPAPPPPAAAPQKAPPPPVPPQAAPSSARPPIPQPPPVAQPRSPAAPGFGMQPPPPLAVSAGALNYAGFGVRLVAAIIDSLLLSALMIPFIIIVVVFMMRMQTGGEPSPLAMIAVFGSYLLMMIASLAYQLIFIGKKGATPGKKFMKLRVTFPDGTYPIGIGKAFVRLIGYMISGMICYIGFLMIIFDKEQHRALHDKMAGTVVIREN
ncbi:RDD family protein [bacterium]|nr:RDD family protein [bacterium]MCI0605894.1 RDD family protein [bacterium]